MANQLAWSRKEPPEKKKKVKPDIPRIKFWSWLGLESVLWGIVIGHIVKWNGNAGYFFGIQNKYTASYSSKDGGGWYFDWYPKDLWDRLPVHISNLFGLGWFPGAHPQHWAPLWWVQDRHGIRDMMIGFFGTIVLTLIFTKPKYPADDVVPVRHYFSTLAKVTLVALSAIGVLMLITWKIPWMQNHGWQVPARFGQVATEVNGWFAAGVWASTLVGVLAALVAKLFVRRVADDIQWFIGERSRAKLVDTSGLNRLNVRVWGTPAHRKRVRYLLGHPELGTTARNKWLVRGLLALMFLAMVGGIVGGWLTLAGPAAVH